jgi:cell pole-organizing protein PopZ
MNAKPDDQDPSMDDILASIRRIMLDEQARLKESGPATPEEAAEHDEPPYSVLVLDDSMAVREPPPEAALNEVADTLPGAPIITTLEPVILEPISMEPISSEAIGTDVTAAEPSASEPTAHEVSAAPAAEPTGPFSQLYAQALEALLAPAAAAAATASVDALLRQLQSERESFLQGDASSGPSLEQVVRGEIRPMLKAWLDEHLPDMVERLVRAELARLTLATGRRV